MAAKKKPTPDKPEKATAKAPKPTKPAKAPKRAALTTARVELSFECGRCLQPVVLSRVGEPQLCRSCLHTWSFAPTSWGSMRAGFAEALRGGRGSRKFGADFGGPYRVAACVEAERARCPCGVEIDEDALVAAVKAGVSCACACGRTMSVRAPDAAVLAMAPGAQAIANEREEAFVPASEPIAFRCACRATLRADGRTRTETCSACGPVDVPTPLWHVLRPVLPRTPLFVVLGEVK